MSLSLSLSVEKAQVVRGESIEFKMTLTNNGTGPVTLLDEDPRNQAFTIRIAGPWGLAAGASASSIREREGDHIDPPRKPGQKVLKPGETMAQAGDVMAWIGELEPGEYVLRATYMDSPPLRAESNEANIKVTDASPVYLRPARQNIFAAYEPRDTAWLHKAAKGFDLFLLRSSPANGALTLSNVSLAHLEDLLEPVPSSFNTSPPVMRHVVWIDLEGNIQVIGLPKEGPPLSPVAVPLPMKELEIVGTPHTDQRGQLFVLIASPEGSQASLARIQGTDKPSFYPIDAKPPLSKPRDVIWTKDDNLVAVWTGPDENELFGANVPLVSPPRRIVPKKLLTADEPIIDVLLVQRPNPDGKAYSCFATVLIHDPVNDLLFRKRIDLGSGAVESDERFEVEGLGNLHHLQSVLTEDRIFCYLFSDPKGVIFVNHMFDKRVPVLDSRYQPVKPEAFPALFVPTRFSRLPGTYVVFIDERRRIACKKVE